MRSLVKEEHEGEKLQDMTELLLDVRSACSISRNVIKPALDSGKWVLGDRHDMSSAYQGGGRRGSHALRWNH